MDYKIGYHHKAQLFHHLENAALAEIVQLIEASEPFPSSFRAVKNGSISRPFKQLFTDHLTEMNGWERDVPLCDITSPPLPGSKIHLLKDRMGVIYSLQHRTTIGTDLLRLERAHSKSVDLIDFGVFVCGTSNFEQFYRVTSDRKYPNTIVFEEVIHYLEMVEELISVPLVIIGIDHRS